MKNNILCGLVVLVYVIGNYSAEAVNCYKCNSNEHEYCVKEPKELPLSSQKECDGYCTILRTEYTDIPGEVVALVRDCEKEPLVLNGVRTDKHYTKMYTSCNEERCNSGDGRRDPNEGNDGRVGPKNVIIVYESASGWMKKSSAFLTIGILCFIYYIH